mmetsp:Transcript_891/g.1912  ORF Transcript_891/g.1912 Transcript_891/m.1912 type:complete len:340 (+) Transcript_891:57-1076(+)
MITLLDARSDSLTITWPAIPGAKRYRLELKTSADEQFRELSSTLTHEQAKKKNLIPEQPYMFRVAPVLESVNETLGSWITHDEAFRTISKTQDGKSMEAPTASVGGNHALVVSWKPAKEVTDGQYELQMRENKGGETWKTIAASLSGTDVRKKNLTSHYGYQFRVRAADSSSSISSFSPPSEASIPRGLSEALKRRWFSTLQNGTLLKNGSSQAVQVPLADALGGKEFVLFYVSAHWCPPCRKFTPMLANWYKTVGKQFAEIVFLSADHDENGFRSYFKSSHPWMAIDYEDDTREQIMATLRVSGIPRLVVINALTGNIIEDNAVGKPLDLNQWRKAGR